MTPPSPFLFSHLSKVLIFVLISLCIALIPQACYWNCNVECPIKWHVFAVDERECFLIVILTYWEILIQIEFWFSDKIRRLHFFIFHKWAMYLPNPFDLLPVIWEQMDEGKQDTTETLKQALMAIIIIFLESRIWSCPCDRSLWQSNGKWSFRAKAKFRTRKVTQPNRMRPHIRIATFTMILFSCPIGFSKVLNWSLSLSRPKEKWSKVNPVQCYK